MNFMGTSLDGNNFPCQKPHCMGYHHDDSATKSMDGGACKML